MLGNSTFEPRVIAATRGTNDSSRCAISLRVSGAPVTAGASLMETTTEITAA